jgi:hypothetical protein
VAQPILQQFGATVRSPTCRSAGREAMRGNARQPYTYSTSTRPFPFKRTYIALRLTTAAAVVVCGILSLHLASQVLQCWRRTRPARARARLRHRRTPPSSLPSRTLASWLINGAVNGYVRPNGLLETRLRPFLLQSGPLHTMSSFDTRTGSTNHPHLFYPKQPTGRWV